MKNWIDPPSQENIFVEADKMSEHELNVAKQQILDDYLTAKKALKTPRSFMVSGLNGAGKTTYRDSLTQQFMNTGILTPNNYITVDLDDIRQYHPRRYDHIQQDFITASALSKPDSVTLTNFLRTETTKRKLHIMTEFGLSSPDFILKLMSEQKKDGYDLELHALTVHPDICRQSVRLRYEEAFALYNSTSHSKGVIPNIFPRWVLTSVQEKAIEGFLPSLQDLISSGNLDSLKIIDRNTVLYEEKQCRDQKSTEQKVTSIYNDATTGKMDDITAGKYLENWDNIINLMDKRNADPIEIENVTHQRSIARIEYSHIT